MHLLNCNLCHIFVTKKIFLWILLIRYLTNAKRDTNSSFLYFYLLFPHLPPRISFFFPFSFSIFLSSPFLLSLYTCCNIGFFVFVNVVFVQLIANLILQRHILVILKIKYVFVVYHYSRGQGDRNGSKTSRKLRY